MDSFDVKILNIIQHNNRLPTEKIAAQVGLSPSAVQRRIKRLREDGIIEAEVAIISPEATGRSLTAIVGVIIDKQLPLSVALKEFKELMLRTPEVTQCYDVTGEDDFIVIVSSRDMQEYEAISRKLFMENPNVRRYKSSLVVRRVKSGTVIPLISSQP
ncbi:MAG TPA: Lrp/AsnC family transcriptional regulator [Pyrinomonadaceae bacterium]|jgi:Lrp/AsnC family leucine-responsive transcriptional regulator|nr:Lrp/AsnC family transcriptional regulator [Pyrinomonadaceae bacterium]